MPTKTVGSAAIRAAMPGWIAILVSMPTGLADWHRKNPLNSGSPVGWFLLCLGFLIAWEVAVFWLGYCDGFSGIDVHQWSILGNLNLWTIDPMACA